VTIDEESMVIDLQEQTPEENTETGSVIPYNEYQDEYMVTLADEEEMSSEYSDARWDTQSEKVQ
jgi:hypothetical protein